jgi:hemerythrin-like metal-binding protein
VNLKRFFKSNRNKAVHEGIGNSAVSARVDGVLSTSSRQTKELNKILLRLCVRVDQIIQETQTSPEDTEPEEMVSLFNQLEKATTLALGLDQSFRQLSSIQDATDGNAGHKTRKFSRPREGSSEHRGTLGSHQDGERDAFFPWGPEMDMPLELFNEQHKRLVQMVNDLYKALLHGRGNEEVLVVIDALLNYTQYHFGAEEKNFEAYKFPGADNHCIIHQNFIQQIMHLRDQYFQGKKTVALQTLRLARSWLFEHIMVCDREYISFFEGKDLYS